MAPTARRYARASIGYSTSDAPSGHAERLVSRAEAASTRHTTVGTDLATSRLDSSSKQHGPHSPFTL